MLTTICILGKPNVGKSTLFNRLCNKRLAIVHDRPGVSRDSKLHIAYLGKLAFNLFDTAGLDKGPDPLTSKMYDAALKAACASDIILFVIDARDSIASEDLNLASIVRKLNKPVILLANKSENLKVIDYNQIYKLGFENVIFVSAEHKIGFDKLEEVLSPLLISDAEHIAEDSIKAAIIGRPNAGKSTLFNRLLKDEKSITSTLPGTTRDAISYLVSHKDTKIELIDTAGLKKKALVTDAVESLATRETITAIRRAHVAVLVIDGTIPLEKQDLNILRVAVQEGKSVILIVNKCDLISQKDLYRQEIISFVEEKIYDLKNMPILFISALKDKSFNRIFDTLLKQNKTFLTNITTSRLNRWLKEAVEENLPPFVKKNKRPSFKYIVQTAVKPPTFTIFGSYLSLVGQSYIKYLQSSLIKTFNMAGVPVRFKYKSSKNPYQKKRK